MLTRASVVVLVLAVAALGVPVAACGDDTDLGGKAPPDGGVEAAAPVEQGPTLSFTTHAPSLTSAAPPATSATWAAYRLDDGEWRVLAPSGPGMYSLPMPVARWSVALACAAADDALSTVFVHHRAIASSELDFTLDDFCSPPAPAAGLALVGNLSNAPLTTQWLDFGYARDARGSTLPASGAAAPYELVGIAPGTWDLGFGVRDEPFTVLTRVALRRGVTVSGDTTLDVDLAGPESFVPGSQQLMLRGLNAGDTVTPTIYYAAGGPRGLDVGPQDVPDGQSDVALAYATVPESAQLATDRYRGALRAEHDRRTGARTISFEIHQAVDLDLTLLPEPASPVVAVLGRTPQLVVETRLRVLPNAQRHEVLVLASLNRRTQHAFRATYDREAVGLAEELTDTTPDLSSLPGWRAAWALPVDVAATVVATAFESAQPLGDGTLQRAASKAVVIEP